MLIQITDELLININDIEVVARHDDCTVFTIRPTNKEFSFEDKDKKIWNHIMKTITHSWDS